MEDEIVLRFKRNGSGYARAKEVARFMDLEIEDYLLKCIEKGHRILRSDLDADLELPEWLRNGTGCWI